MREHFKVGDHVHWSSEAGHVSGAIVAAHKNSVLHHASRRGVS